MEKIIIFGNGRIAQIAHYYLSLEKNYKVVGFTVDKEFIKDETFLGLKVVNFACIEKYFPPQDFKMLIAISYSKMNKIREDKYLNAKNKGYKFINYISPYATIYNNVHIGENCFIFEDNTIQPFVKIGNNVTLWSGNHIGHHSDIGDNCFISSHVVVSGGVTIKPNCFIGVNSSIRDHITIRKENIIGAGSIIMRSTKEKEVYIPERTKKSKFKSDMLNI